MAGLGYVFGGPHAKDLWEVWRPFFPYACQAYNFNLILLLAFYFHTKLLHFKVLCTFI